MQSTPPQSTVHQRAAELLQLSLRASVDLNVTGMISPKTVAGLDVSYAVGSDRLVAAAVVLDLSTMSILDQATVSGMATFPYVPGLLAFRELPFLLSALDRLRITPDVLVCDGYGIAHPRRFGLACHMGVVAGLPSFGVAKTPFTATFSPPGPARGDWSVLREGDEVLGRVLRTRAGVKPVFVSVGHRIGLDEATSLTLALTPRYRLPETTRQADHLSRRVLRTIEECRMP